MSVRKPSIPDRIALPATDPATALQHGAASIGRALLFPVRFLAFWVAALLPLAYVPMLLTGLVARHPLAFLGLLAANCVAAVLGHPHKQP